MFYFHPHLGKWSNFTISYVSNGLVQNHQLRSFFGFWKDKFRSLVMCSRFQFCCWPVMLRSYWLMHEAGQLFKSPWSRPILYMDGCFFSPQLAAQVLLEVSSRHNPWLMQIHLVLDHALLDHNRSLSPRKMVHLDVTTRIFDTSPVEKLHLWILRVPNGYGSKLGNLHFFWSLEQ